jgi:hypothetical protein
VSSDRNRFLDPSIPYLSPPKQVIFLFPARGVYAWEPEGETSHVRRKKEKVRVSKK